MQLGKKDWAISLSVSSKEEKLGILLEIVVAKYAKVTRISMRKIKGNRLTIAGSSVLASK